jgi:hypothetical protein
MAKTPHIKLKRRRRPEERQAIAQHAIRTGAVLWEYNLVYAALGVLYSHLLEDDHATAMAMWHSILNDDQKRKILLAAAELKLAKKPAILARLNWLLKKIGQLSGYRNIAAHLPLGLDRNEAGEYVVAPGDEGISSPTSSQKFIFVQLERVRFWETLAEDYYLLGQYVVWLTWHASGKLKLSQPLPYKPRLPSLAAILR